MKLKQLLVAAAMTLAATTGAVAADSAAKDGAPKAAANATLPPLDGLSQQDVKNWYSTKSPGQQAQIREKFNSLPTSTKLLLRQIYRDLPVSDV